MTYDKVQFALNKHHYVQHRNSEENKSVNPAVEVEKVSISPVRQKRKISAYDSTLPNINEVAEEKRGSENDISFNELKDRKLQAVEEKIGAENEHSIRREIKNRDILEDKAIRVQATGEQKAISTYSKYFIAEKQSLGDEMSVSSRHLNGNGSDVNAHDKFSKSESSHGKGTESSEAFENESNTDTVVRVPRLDIGEDRIYKRMKQLNSLSNKGSAKGTGVGSPLSEHGDESTKLSNVKCEHMLSMQTGDQDISLTKRYEINTKIKIDPDKCMICEVTEATAKYASVEANRLLLEIVYPHEFYDKFQRSGKRTKVKINQKGLDTSKEQISICRSVPVAAKPWRRERTTILPSQPSAPDHPDPPNTVRETYRNRTRERSEHDLSPQKRIKRDGETESRKEVHLHCKAKNNALVVTDDSEGQKLVLKGLKGWILKKDDTCKNKMHKEIKKSLYQVNSLGMKFSIPEYNTSLSNRKPQSASVLTYVTSPRPLDAPPPIRKSVTQSISPRNHVTYPIPHRDVQTVPTRTINGLQRGYTHVPKLFSDTSTEEPFKGFQLAKVNTPGENKSIENSSIHKGSTKLSLPPISNDMKSRSLTLSQF